MRSRTAGFRAGLLFAVAILGLRAAATDVFVAPGDTGKIQLDVRNLRTASVPGVRIPLGSNSRFQVEAGSELGPFEMQSGWPQSFFALYTIPPDAPEGDISVALSPTADMADLEFDPEKLTAVFKVDAVAPALTISDSRGVVAVDGATKGLGMIFAADDRLGPAGQAATVVSGIEKIEVFTNPPVSGNRIGVNSTAYADHHSYTLSELGLTSLPEGLIHVTITDRAGNASSKSFLVDRVVPTIALANNEAVPIAFNSETDSGFITATCADASSGIDQVSVLNGSGGPPVRGPFFENGAPVISADFADLPDNNPGENYIARVLDRAGNQTDFPFRVRHAPYVALNFTATSAFDYIFEYYGASVQTFSIPYSTAAFFISDAAGVGGFELKRNGAVVYSESYPAGEFTKNISLNLADGDYEFKVDTVRGQFTSGAFTKYTVALTPVLTRPQAVARLEDGVFKVNFPVTCSNTGPIGTGLSALTIRRIAVEGIGINAQHVFKETTASLACGASFDGHLQNGLYGVVGLDHGYEIINYFTIDTQPVAMQADFRDGIFNQVDTAFDGFDLRLSTTGVFVKAVPDPVDTRTVELVAASGSADSRSIDLFASSDTLIVPYGAIGVALSTPLGSALNFSAVGEFVEEVVGDTGLSQAFALSSDGGAFLPVARWKLFLAPTPACAGVEFCAHLFDYQLDQTQPMTMIGPSITVRQTLTNNTAIFRGNTPGSVTPLAGFPPLSFLYVMTSTVAIEDMPLDSAAGLPAIAGNPAFQISGPHAGVLVFLADPNDPTLLAKVAELKSRGQKWAGGSIALVDPPLLQFNSPAVATMRFDPAAAAAAGIPLADLALYQAEPGGNFYRVANQVLSVSEGFISAPVLRLSQASLFGIFGPGVPPSAPVVDVLPPRTTFSGSLSAASGQTISVSSLSVLSFSAPDDKAMIGDAQGVGAARTYYATDGGSFVVVPGTFSLVAEGTHTLTFFSVDLYGNAELTKAQAVAVDVTAPTAVVVSSRALFVISAVDPIVNGAASGVNAIRYLVDFNPGACNGVVPNPAAMAGTCENPDYAGPFPLTNGPHMIAFRVTDKVGNDTQWQFQQVEVVPQSENGGLGIGRDAFDAFWSVLSGRDAFGADILGFARANSSGVLLSSSTLLDASFGMPWSVLFDQGGRAYAIGGAAGPSTQALDLAVYKASPEGDAIESRTLFDSGFANNDLVFDAKAPGWLVGSAQTSGPADFNAVGDRNFSLALWRFDPALGTVQLKTTYTRAGFDLGAGLAVDTDGSLWIAGYSLSPAAPVVGGFDLALWHYAADGQTLLGGPFLRPGYLNDIDGGLTARIFVTSQAVYVAAPRADADGVIDMAFLRYDKATGLPTSENAWRSSDGAPSYPVAILPQTSGILVAGGIGANFTEAGLWRFGFDGSLVSATTADAGGAKGAVFRGSQLWLSVDGSSSPYRVQAEAAAVGSLIDLQPPRTDLSAGLPSFIDGQTVYATSATPLGFIVVDDNAVTGDGLGAGATQTFYAEDGGAYIRFTSSFTLVAEGTHTISFFSIDLKGHAEASKTRIVGVDLTAPSAALVSSGTVFTIAAVDPVVGGAASGVGQIVYIVDHSPDCEGIVESSAAPHGTCENLSYAGPFELAVGTHTVYFAASDHVLNGAEVVYSSFVTVTPPIPTLAAITITPSTASIEVNATAQFAAAGTFSDGSTRTLTGEVEWTTDAPSVTTITAPGLARGLAPGTALVIASSGAVSASATLNVRVPVLTALAVTPSTATVESGDTVQFAAAGTFSDGSTRMLTGEVEWRTDALSVAEVDQTGLALGVGGGTAHVIASSDAISGQATLTVTLATPTVSSISPASAENGTSVAAAVVGTGFDRSAALSLERSDALRGTWAPTGSFTQGRYASTLTKLPDGRALLAGGIVGDATVGSANADLYDPATGLWTAGRPLNYGRNQYVAVALNDGRVLVAGGYGAGSPLKSVEIYDPALSTWTIAAPMSSVRVWPQLAVLSDGRVLAAGGHNGASYLNSAEIYDPTTNVWSPAASMGTARAAAAMTRLSDGKLLAVGGFGDIATAEVYNPAANTWTPAGSMSVGRAVARSALLPDGKVLVSGGGGGGADVYNPATNGWTATSPMVTVRTVHALVLVNGTALAIGGENGATALASTEIYDALTNVWRSGPALTAPRTWLLQAVTLNDGRVLVAGGLASVGGAVLNTAELLGGAAVSIGATQVTVTDARHLSGILALTGAATGYWDVVVRESGGRIGRLTGGFQVLPRTPTLSSIAVTPAAAEIEVGATAQFTAAGTFSDGSMRTLTGEVVWTTDVSSAATVSVSGLATGVGGGTAHVIASSGAISGQAALTVRAPPPVVSSISPASAETGTNIAATVVGENFGTAMTMSLERVSDVLRGTWTVTGLFAQGRYASTLTKLPDGRALLAGGIVGDTTVGSAAVDRYDPATGLWTAAAPLNQGRNQYVAVALADGRVLVAGGYGSGSPTNSVEIYDPAQNTWTTVRPMSAVRVWPQLSVLSDGRVLAAGGHNGSSYLNSAEIYDPVANVWTPTGSMNTARAGAAMVTLNDGRALAVGGFGDIATAEIFNPAANAWTPAGSMSVGRAVARSALLPDGKVLVSGGGGGGADVYNPVANAWAATNPMVTVRTVHALVLVNGTALAIGGENSSSALASTEIYDAQTNAWRSGPALTAPRTWLLQALTLDDGRVLVAGGRASVGGAVLNTAEILGAPSFTIAATEVTVLDAQHLSGTLALTGAATGYWDVAVRESGGRVGRLTGGFLVLPRTPTLSSIAVTPSTASIEVGTTVQFAAAGTFTDGSTRTMTGEVAWMTDAPLVATVTVVGLSTGLAPGIARVIASSGAISAQAELTVRTPVLTALAVTPSAASILTGATVQFAAAGTFTDGSTRTMTGAVSWMTDISTVATVGPTGLALGEGGGTAHVIASSGAVAGQATLNIAYVATSTGTVGGSPELTLVSTAPFSVVIASTETGAGAVALGSASVQGLILVGTVYEVHREDLGATAILTWYFDPALVDAAMLAIWRFDGISWSSVTVLNQVVSVTDGAGTVTGEVVLTSLFALFSRDIIAPVTALLVDGLPADGASLSLVPTNAIGFTSVDVGVGVRETRYTLDGGAETIFVAPFRLATGAHTLAYHSIDRAGNQEAARTVEIAVTNPSGDSAPPLVSLDFPGASALGVERAVGGVVSVRGSASDASALTWTLKAGSAVLASGTGNVSGALAAWDTTALSGTQTLTLSAVDASGNAAIASAQVFVGAPVMTFAIGRKDSDAIVSTLKGPTGIAVRSDGSVWVASTENDQILLISPTGVLLGAAGQAPGHSGEDKEDKKGKKDEDHDDGNSVGLSFKSPQGLALDAAGNLYVADRDLDRVVKLSPDGRALLLQIGKTDGKGRPKPGSGPGELRNPFDVAVDGNGDIYVADSGNRRISVFNASGIFLRQFGQGALPAASEVRGLALTSEGLWVSDKESERIYLFSRAGILVKSIGDADSVVGEISRTRGLAADRLGALYVIEPNRDRAQKFDPQGKGLLAFGSLARLSHFDKKAKRYLTQPIDAALAPDGSLWITDAGRDRIVRYAIPSSGNVASTWRGGRASGSVERARRVVDHKDGAKVERDDGAGVRVPKGALAADLEITVDKGDENQDKEQKTAKRRHMRIKAVSEEVQYGPEGTTFNTPVTLTVPYDANLIAAQGIREDELKVYYWNPGLKDWQAMPSTVDKLNKTVNAQTNHFSAYQVQGPGGGIGVAAVIDEFGLRDQYAFPNPSRNGAPVTFRIQPGLADSIEVRVYDLSGRKIHSSSDFRFSVLDDGNGKGAQNTYDHAWDISGIGSGVYTYVITATRAGQTPIIKSGKAGVIK